MIDKELTDMLNKRFSEILTKTKLLAIIKISNLIGNIYKIYDSLR